MEGLTALQANKTSTLTDGKVSFLSLFPLFFEGSLISLPDKKICICIQPQPQNLTVGDALVLECRAVGNPIPQYQWFRNGFPLANGSKNVYMVSYCRVLLGGLICNHL